MRNLIRSGVEFLRNDRGWRVCFGFAGLILLLAGIFDLLMPSMHQYGVLNIVLSIPILLLWLSAVTS